MKTCLGSIVLLLLGACGGSSGKGNADLSGPPGSDLSQPGSMACTAGSALTTLPACSSAVASAVSVPSGCAPTVDGTYHSGEWSDAACITVGSDPVYIKYSGATLYLAWPMTPTCGCPAQLAFNMDSAMTLDGHQIDLSIFDDPSSATGDSGEFTSQAGGGWMQDTAVASGITIANPPGAPALVTYEVAIPFSQLGITAGQSHTVGLGINHSMSGMWPAGLTEPAGMFQPADPTNWGQLMSSANWQ
jgi:hypothetical protein